VGLWQKFVYVFVAYIEAIKAMRRGRLWQPFLLYLLIEFSVVGLLYFGVRPGLAAVFSGPLSFAIPARFFHYPDHLLLLAPVTFRMLIPFGALLESLLVAAGTLMFVSHFQGQAIPSTAGSIAEVKPKYIQFVLFWLITFALLYGYQMLFGSLTKDLWTGFAKRRMAVEFADIGLSSVINALLAYTTVVIVIGRTSVAQTIQRALRMFRRNFFSTCTFVFVSTLLVFPLNATLRNAGGWMGRFNPEVLLLVVAGSLVAAAVSTFLLVGLLTFWYLQYREAT
jgi:hypothetical protein